MEIFCKTRYAILNENYQLYDTTDTIADAIFIKVMFDKLLIVLLQMTGFKESIYKVSKISDYMYISKYK